MNQHFREMWSPPWYHTKMGSCEVTQPPKAPYRRLYHLTSAGFATSNIALRRLKVARWNDLNDPFELQPYRVLGALDASLFSQVKEDFSQSQGLLCMSRDWTNPVIWSHYGDKHRGIALGFDVDSSKLWMEDVRYSEDRLDSPVNVKLLLSTKAISWEYEEEVRIIIELAEAEREGGLHFFPFDEDLQLREVILGPDCTQSLEHTRELVDKVYAGVSVVCARRANRHFKVVPDESTVLLQADPAAAPRLS